MLRITVLALMLVIVGGIPAVGADAVEESAVCGDVRSYFQDLDKQIFDEMRVYLEDEDWVKDMERMSRKANANESGLLTLSESEMQPFIDIISVPGDVLLDYPEDQIPDLVRPLHDSGMSYWLMMPAMMRTISTGGVFAAMIFVEDMEAASTDNLAALGSLEAACPLLVDEMSKGSGEEFFDDGMENSGAFDLDSVDTDDLIGFAYSILTLPADEAE